MAQTYQVQVGDNVSAIAKRFGVQPGAITGFKSNNPNVIFPGDVLTINSPVAAPAPAPAPVTPQGPQITPQGDALVAPTAPPAAPPAPPSPVTPQGVQTPAPAAPGAAPVAPVASTAAPATPVAPSTPATPAARTFTTPSGVVVDENGQIVQAPVESGLDSILQELANTDPAQANALMSALGYSNAPTQALQRFGLSPQKLEQGFSTNPTGTLSTLVQQVLQMTGLPDARKGIEDITKQITDLEENRDKEIQKVNDNPFTSATTKQQLIQQTTDAYDKRISYRTNRLTLLQNTYSQARQEAQFAVTTAVGLYDKNRQYTQDQLKLYLDTIEKAQSAKKNLSFDLSPGQIRYQLNPKTGQYEPVAVNLTNMKKLQAAADAADVPTITNPQAQKYAGALSVILGSANFTKEQKASIVNAVNNGEDPVSVIKNQAKNVMGQTEATKITGYETAKAQVQDLQTLLREYYANGGETSFLSGNYEKVINKIGEVDDPNLVNIATQIASALQIYRNAISGTAYSVQEGTDIASIFPGINKSKGLNTAIMKGRLAAFDSTIDGAYRSALDKTYDSLKTETTPTSKLSADIQNIVTSNLTFSPDGKTAYIPREVWSTLGANMDAVLAEAKADGVNLLIK